LSFSLSSFIFCPALQLHSRSFDQFKAERRTTLETILCVYLAAHPEEQYQSSMIHLLSPFLACIEQPAEIYYSFSHLQTMLGNDDFFSLSNFFVFSSDSLFFFDLFIRSQRGTL
jgi:hypothetical protein